MLIIIMVIMMMVLLLLLPATATDDDVADVEDVWTATVAVSREDFDCNVATLPSVPGLVPWLLVFSCHLSGRGGHLKTLA